MASIIEVNKECHLLVGVVVHDMLVSNDGRTNLITYSKIEVETSSTAVVVGNKAHGVKQELFGKTFRLHGQIRF